MSSQKTDVGTNVPGHWHSGGSRATLAPLAVAIAATVAAAAKQVMRRCAQV